MMYFTADGKHAKVEYYSTVFDKYFCESNKTIKLTFGKDEPEETTAPDTEAPITAAPETTTDTTTDVIEEKGCGSTVCTVSVLLILLPLAGFIKRRKVIS
jgi:hypothetical protein